MAKTKRLPKFKIYRSINGWRWRLLSANRRILASGEAHPSKGNAKRAIKTMTQAAVHALPGAMWEV